MTRRNVLGLLWLVVAPLQWRHNGRNSVSNHQPHDCLLNRLFRCRSKKISKLRVTGLCAGNSPGTAQMARYAENVSIWWCHHAHGGHFYCQTRTCTYDRCIQLQTKFLETTVYSVIPSALFNVYANKPLYNQVGHLGINIFIHCKYKLLSRMWIIKHISYKRVPQMWVAWIEGEYLNNIQCFLSCRIIA